MYCSDDAVGREKKEQEKKMICANILWYLNFHTYKLKKGSGQCRIASYIEAITMWMLCAFLISEGLSLFHGINRISLGVSWVVTDVILLVFLLRQRKEPQGLEWSRFFPMREFGKNKLNWCLAACVCLFPHGFCGEQREDCVVS